MAILNLSDVHNHTRIQWLNYPHARYTCPLLRVFVDPHATRVAPPQYICKSHIFEGLTFEFVILIHCSGGAVPRRHEDRPGVCGWGRRGTGHVH